MSDFTYIPTYQMDVKKTPRVMEVKFGDGYVQAAPDGINTTPEVWTLTFSELDDTTANAIMDFFDTRQGAYTFTWTNPRGVENKYVCKEYSRSHVAENVNAIQATFEQRYG